MHLENHGRSWYKFGEGHALLCHEGSSTQFMGLNGSLVDHCLCFKGRSLNSGENALISSWPLYGLASETLDNCLEVVSYGLVSIFMFSIHVSSPSTFVGSSFPLVVGYLSPSVWKWVSVLSSSVLTLCSSQSVSLASCEFSFSVLAHGLVACFHASSQAHSLCLLIAGV